MTSRLFRQLCLSFSGFQAGNFSFDVCFPWITDFPRNQRAFLWSSMRTRKLVIMGTIFRNHERNFLLFCSESFGAKMCNLEKLFISQTIGASLIEINRLTLKVKTKEKTKREETCHTKAQLKKYCQMNFEFVGMLFVFSLPFILIACNYRRCFKV